MPRILAIDWDRLEARAVLLSSGAAGTSVGGAWAVSLASAEGTTFAAREIGSRLAAAMSGAAEGNVTTLVGVGREQVQMVLLSLPPAPPEELPDLVRFQAERELTSLGADAALDYIQLAGDATTPHRVLVAALAGEGLAEVRELAQAIGVEPDRITLRATAAASFVARRLKAGASEVSLVVNRLIDEADFTVLVGDQVELVRTVRLPDASDSVARGRVLAGEIRRTIAAVRQQLGERNVGRVVLCGNASESAEAAALATELGLAVEVFDVAENSPSGLTRAGLSPESLARFSAVLGMALGEADRREPVVDFLNIRRRDEPQKITRQRLIAATAAAVAVLSIGLLLWQRSASLSRELERLNAETAQLDTQFQQDQFGDVIDKAASIEKWLATDVNWLDELHRLSLKWRPESLDAKKFPVADDAVVTQLTAFRPPGNDARGGRVAIQAVARSQSAVAALEQRLRDAEYTVGTGSGKTDSTVPGYIWSFGRTIDILPADDSAGGCAMNTQREKILAAVVLGMLLLWGGAKLFQRYGSALATKRSNLITARGQLDDAKLALERGRLATKQLVHWQKLSLPADREVAQSLYRVWLETQFKQAGLTIDDIQPSQRLAPAAGYTAVGYTVSARGSLKSLTGLLHDFYRSPLLQQITRLALRPATDRSLLDITLQTEALIVPGTTNDTLPEGVVDRPAKANAADYAQSVGGRNVFAVYTPPRPAPSPTTVRAAPPKPEFDDAKHAYFTGTIQVDGRFQAWIHVRTTGETLRLFEGDEVKVGLLDGKIVSIEPRLIVVKSGDQELRVELGHNLRDSQTAEKTEEG